MRWRRLGLAKRLMLIQAFLAALLGTTLAVVVWVAVSDRLVEHHRLVAVARAATDAQAVAFDLSENVSPEDAMGRVAASPGTVQLVLRGREWHMSGTPSDPEAELRSLLTPMTEAQELVARRIEVDDTDLLAVMIPLAELDASYIQVSSVDDLDRRALLLGIGLAGGTLGLVVIAVAMGALSGRMALRPIVAFSRAASAAARGEPAVRLEAADDPDLAELAESFNASAEALSQRVIADARFAGDVGHELRTPITTMLNAMFVIQAHREVLDPAAREALDLLSEEIEGFRRLVVDLLEISQVDAGVGLDVERVQIGALARRVADHVTGRPVAHVEEEVSVFADERRIERVVANLVRNAEIHGGGCLAVTVASAGQGGVLITVEDAGEGVPADRRDRIFERFVSEGGGHDPGNGLGLAIVLRHVRAHGGTVRVDDRPGGGARFVVQLPRRARSRTIAAE
ncbi:MAG: HAMP domain-containing histidine kinase [Nocardioides sp.]|nr:HAMP domain-containing histidine kinase [Nocardioides sp.]